MIFMFPTELRSFWWLNYSFRLNIKRDTDRWSWGQNLKLMPIINAGWSHDCGFCQIQNLESCHRMCRHSNMVAEGATPPHTTERAPSHVKPVSSPQLVTTAQSVVKVRTVLCMSVKIPTSSLIRPFRQPLCKKRPVSHVVLALRHFIFYSRRNLPYKRTSMVWKKGNHTR